MQHIDIEMVMFFLTTTIAILGGVIVIGFIMETINWSILKMIMIEAGLIYTWIWISKQED